VSGGVVIVTSVKILTKFVAARGGSAGKSRVPTSSEAVPLLATLEARPVPVNTSYNILPLFNFVEAGILTTTDELS
jgi:hypothetical protein